MRLMKGKEVRSQFLKFFEERGHRVVRSSPLLPENDPTLLFTNAGMNQFKNVFLGKENRDYSRAASCQKCVRAGGKHNDLENVGRTARHHTFFEMLGNFSFGDYFKEDAILFAWDLVTRVYGLDADRMYATVFREDDEAATLWRKISGLPAERVLRLGEKDNFWAMGDTGPCGPCSEILYDLGVSPEGHTDCPPDCECGRYLEIWNLVFMQYERDDSGKMTPLPAPSIDTGLGLERLTSVMQGKLSNYDTDLFMPLIQQMEQKAGIDYGRDPRHDLSMRIIADHSRAGAFLVADGIIPANEGRGYVLRKILRRAIRHGRLLGLHDTFLHEMTGHVAELMGEAYDELIAARDYVQRVIRTEEEKFSSTLEFGLRKLDEMVPADAAGLPGVDIFKLYDTYGFPLDLLEEIAEERGWQLDMAGFHAELDKQKERARASWKGDVQLTVSEDIRTLSKQHRSTFLGYETIVVDDARVLAVLQDDRIVPELKDEEEGQILLDKTPFYAESGGQIGDQGVLRGEDFAARVQDTVTPVEGLVLHRVKVWHGRVKAGETLRAEVDEQRRHATACNHTATHLLHAALRDVLGEHVKQAGSLVAPDRLRFDFTHFAPLTPRELEIIEEMVNEQIWKNRSVSARVVALDQALEDGAMALFGEKYRDKVRMITVDGFSRELCGGTHLNHTGEMGVFKIISESSIASGVRRIEAITGPRGYERFARDEQVLASIYRDFKVSSDQLPEYLAELQNELKARQKDIDRLKLKMASRTLDEILNRAGELDGIKVISGVVADVDRSALRSLADQLLKRFSKAIVALGAEIDGKASLVVMVSEDVAKQYPAGKLVGALARMVGGGGGGRPTMAEAGGKDPARLHEAMNSVMKLLQE
jgi:alanyl-tRNA synthetase